MILVYSADENWAIGYEGDVLIKISEDLKRFRKITIKNIIIMGRKTFESLPDSKALDSRINIILTREKEYNPPNSVVVHSIEELFQRLKEINPEGKMENYLIGGGNLANQLLDNCKKAYITKIFKTFDKADTFLHNLDEDDKWEVEETSNIYYQDEVGYQYVNYIKVEE
ncbi:MAG TPA: dihydrofolate reductase [Tissierellaceae bacterium]|nr:dihydrofolate reductase [Tissierellaceae bacterium]